MGYRDQAMWIVPYVAMIGANGGGITIPARRGKAVQRVASGHLRAREPFPARDAFICMQTCRGFAQALERSVAAGLVGAIVCFTAGAASAGR